LQRENRRLAAIVAADIAGYSRLIGQDGEGTLKVESKDEMKRRGVASPDVADVFSLTFAGTAGLVTRGGMSRRWQQAIDYPSSAWIV